MKTRGLVYCLVVTLCLGATWANGQTTIYVSRDGLCSGHSPCYSTIQAGIDALTPPSTLKITEETYSEDVVLDVNQLMALEGGWDTGFTSCSSYTMIRGSIRFSDGTAVIGVTGRIIVSPPPPTVISFAANPDAVNTGQSSSLSWSIASATSASIDHGVGSVNPVVGSVNVSPAATTVYTLTAANGAGSLTAQATVTVIVPPTINVFSVDPATINLGGSSTLSWTITNATSASIDHGVGSVNPASGSVDVSPTTTTTYTLTAANGAGSVTAQITVTVIVPPIINSFSADPGTINLGGSSTLSWTITDATSASINQGVGAVNPSSGSTSISPTSTTTYTLTATNSAGSVTAQAAVTVNGGLPPDPTTVAPPIDPTIATTVSATTQFLYTGTNPIQTGVVPGTIEPKRVAVLRGNVLDHNSAPLPGVKITILNHPEYGQTLTRLDGVFDMVVNGGGVLAVKYEKEGYLPLQRQANVPWQEYMWFPEVRMMPADPNVTVINLNDIASEFQIARGSVQTDERGSRQSTLLFPKGTQAWLIMPDGNEEPISSLSIRATEYTVGPEGPQRMPAELPPNSAYTYCEEFNADEAVAAGATGVRFSQPLISYNENFLNFPVGTGIPMGSYNRERGVWVPSDSGKVIKILNIAGDPPLAELDTDGDGSADNGVSLGITIAERATLASLYAAGQSLWRVPFTHFTPWDKNMGMTCDDRRGPCVEPKEESPFQEDPLCPGGSPATDEQYGSIIGCQGQTLGEISSLTGTPFHLRYQSDRVRGRKDAFTLRIPLTGPTISGSMKKIILQITVAGRTFEERFDPAPDLSYTFTWDGRDAYGRTLQGRQPISVKIGYGYGMIYAQTDRFGYNGNGVPISISEGYFTMWQWHSGLIGLWDAQAQGLGGWTLNVHHAYEPLSRTLNLGDGRHRSASAELMNVINAVAWLYKPGGVAVGPEGNVYVSRWADRIIQRIAPNGAITTFAGTGAAGYSGDGGPATEAKINGPGDIATGPDGSVYFVDQGDLVIRKVDRQGIITTVAGNGTVCFWPPWEYSPCNDGAPATQAKVQANAIAVGPDGSIYIAGANRVRRVGPDGIIANVAGNGGDHWGFVGGVPARSTAIGNASGIAVGPDGSLFISDRAFRVLKVTPDGIINAYAGSGTWGFSGDGGPATSARLDFTADLALARDGSLYIVDYQNGRIRRVGTDGIINTVAGGSDVPWPDFGEGGPAAASEFNMLQDVAVGPDGSLYVADMTNSYGLITRVRYVLPSYLIGDFFLPSEDGSEVYLFDGQGRHLKTLHALTGATLYEFVYDSAGLLIKIKDRDGNLTRIERDAATGHATAVKAPFGQTTTLQMDPNGYLAAVMNPAGEATQFNYTSEGLLTGLTDPRRFSYAFTFDSLGRLIKDEDPAGGIKTLARTETLMRREVAWTTAEGRKTSYLVENLLSRDERMTNTFPDGTQTVETMKTDGSQSLTLPSGVIQNSVFGPDPRFGMQAPLPKSTTITTPGNITLNSTMARTVALSNPSDPLSVTNKTDTVKINNRQYTSAYNASALTFTDTTPAGRQTTSKIDSKGRLVEYQRSGLSSTRYSYDAQGRLIDVTHGSGADARSITLQYNSEGYLSDFTDPLSGVTSFQYDLAGRVTKGVLPDAREAVYTYDANGNTTSITPPARPAHSFGYSPIDLMVEYIPPDVLPGLDKTRYAYNKDRQITQVLRPDGQTIDFGYDTAGRPGNVVFSRGTVAYDYFPATGQLQLITAPEDISLAFSYDGMLLKSETWAGPVTGMVSFTYDSDFRLNSLKINDSQTIAFQYDSDKLVTKAGDLALTYNGQNGLLTGTALGNVTDAWAYNGFGEPINYNAKYNASEIFKQQFTYDKKGRIVEKAETIEGVANTYKYTYDVTGRLTKVEKDGTSVTYGYDGNDNRLSMTAPAGTTYYTYDAQDRLVTANSEIRNLSYGYTANGELLTKTEGAQITAYNYDTLGNLKSVQPPIGSSIEYLVDGRNRRIGKKVGGALTGGFLYLDDLKPVAELDDAGNVVSIFVYGGRYATPDYMVKEGVTYRIISDHVGSPRLVVNTATGEIVQRMNYDEFGNALQDTNPGFQPFGFAGGLYDPQAGLVRFGARDYDPEVGRWTAKDPLLFGLWGSTNTYEYVLSDPVNLIDPEGMQPLPRTPMGPKPQPMQDKEWVEPALYVSPPLSPQAEKLLNWQNDIAKPMMQRQFSTSPGGEATRIVFQAMGEAVLTCFGGLPRLVPRLPGRWSEFVKIPARFWREKMAEEIGEQAAKSAKHLPAPANLVPTLPGPRVLFDTPTGQFMRIP